MRGSRCSFRCILSALDILHLFLRFRRRKRRMGGGAFRPGGSGYHAATEPFRQEETLVKFLLSVGIFMDGLQTVDTHADSVRQRNIAQINQQAVLLFVAGKVKFIQAVGRFQIFRREKGDKITTISQLFRNMLCLFRTRINPFIVPNPAALRLHTSDDFQNLIPVSVRIADENVRFSPVIGLCV